MASNTTGEKDFEEFYTNKELLDVSMFKNIGVIKNKLRYDENKLNYFEMKIRNLKSKGIWSKQEIVNEFFKIFTEFKYIDNGKYLDSKM